jgi:hypothetical protein
MELSDFTQLIKFDSITKSNEYLNSKLSISLLEEYNVSLFHIRLCFFQKANFTYDFLFKLSYDYVVKLHV